MRPIRMTVSAFGPFAEEVQIDFEKLGNQGLYLITGDTGAGKTTIFDAIIFALYGEASGGYRESTMFRSKYAKPERKTFVELVFSYNNMEYTVRRNPEYERPKERGEGMTVQKAEAELYFPDDRQPVTKASEVTKAVTDIIGLDRNQFTQIAMLAQGEFRKFLMAPTKDKEVIFRNIFHTGNYQLLQNKLGEEARKCYREYDKLKQRTLQIMEGITCEPDSVHEQRLLQMKEVKELVDCKEFEELQQDIVDEQKTLIEQIDKEKIQEESRLATLNEKIGVAESLQKAEEELALVQQFLKTAGEELEKRKTTEREAVSEGKVCDELTAKAAQIEQKLGEYGRQTELFEKLTAKKKDYEQGEKQLEDGRKKLDTIKKEIDDKQQVLEEKKDCGRNRVQTENKVEQGLRRKEELSNLQTLFSQFEKQKKDVQKAQKACEKKLAEYQSVSEEYNHLQQGFILAQAGILAQGLKEKQPCPVCGSISHPHPAQLSEEVCTKEELESKKEEVTRKDAEAKKEGLKVERLLSACEATKEQITVKSGSLVGETDIDKVKELVLQKISENESEIAESKRELECLKKGEQEWEEANQQFPVLVKKRQGQEEMMASVKESQTEKKKDMEHWTAELENLQKELAYEDEKTARGEIDKLKKQKAKLQKAMEEAKKAVLDYEKEIAGQEVAKQTLEKQLAEGKGKPLSELQAERTQLRGRIQQLQNRRDDIYRRYQNNVESGRQVLKEWGQLSETEEKYKSIQNLSDTMNGNLKGKDKVMLETYIQMTYFDRILNRANIRLLKMTDGQYELRRKKEASNQRSQSGLELDVKDYYNGTLRSVHTLSGGESFMASLALALGLSDEIQMGAGGIRLDTMFVDEGFGSLDDETLSKAIEVLAGLTEGNRLVGIISHVTELKQRIDKQIVVTKDMANGSGISLVTD
ncbi:MAG: SMC family ATPase [Clostridiales bacterium]|nr:SMC family ATPase [Clostridiales bacterium]